LPPGYDFERFLITTDNDDNLKLVSYELINDHQGFRVTWASDDPPAETRRLHFTALCCQQAAA
jgi:hypothetical protein